MSNEINNEREHVIVCSQSKAFRLMEKLFWNYADIVNEVNLLRKEQDYYKIGEPTGGAPTGHAYVADPAASLTIKHNQKIEKISLEKGTPSENTVYYPEEWLDLIKDVLTMFKDDKLVGDVLMRRYIWGEDLAVTCKNLKLNYGQYRLARNVGMYRAIAEAWLRGLLEVSVDTEK